MTKKPALGRGLSALLEDHKTDITSENKNSVENTLGSIAELPINQIEANPFQPRNNFEEEKLIELAQSIKELGIIQPLTVRKLGYNKYQLISGERRFRASQLAGLSAVPAFIRLANDQAMLEMALVENIQRANLNAIEVSLSYQRLIEECKLTQEELSQRVGKKRSTISNYLRLLKLPAEIQIGIAENQLSMGHARALITIDDEQKQLNLFNQILKDKLSVRKTEELSKAKKSNQTSPKKSFPLSLSDKKLQSDISNKINLNVQLKRNDIDKGKLTISFESDEELNQILNLLNK
jgi:ParB family chromosome partitioning protein